MYCSILHKIEKYLSTQKTQTSLTISLGIGMQSYLPKENNLAANENRHLIPFRWVSLFNYPEHESHPAIHHLAHQSPVMNHTHKKIE